MKNLRIDSAEAKAYLKSPYQIIDGKDYWVTPFDIENDRVNFQVRQFETIKKPGFLKRWFTSLRAISLTVMVIPTLCVLFAGKKLGYVADSYSSITGILIPSLLLLAVNVKNDVEDHLRLIDLPGTNGGSGVIQKGWISPSELTTLSRLLILIAFCLSIPLLLRDLRILGGAFLLTLISTVGYSSKPFNFKYIALGDLIVFLMCGPILTGIYGYVTFGIWHELYLHIGTLFGLLATTILHANNLNDINVDQKRGAKTFGSLLGFRGSKVYMLCLYLASTAIIVWQGKFFKSYFLLALAIPLLRTILLMIKIYMADSPDARELKDIRFITPQIHLLTGAILCIGLVTNLN